MKCRKLLLTLAGLSAVIFFNSCSTFTVPKEYVPDSKVVFLMQNTDFGPIKYDAAPADPYTFQSDTTAVDSLNPRFLRDVTFESLLKPDYAADCRLYREVSTHFEYVLALPLFLQLRPLLDGADIQPPVILPPNKGEQLQTYTNGAEFDYPDTPGAKITVLDSGMYFIQYSDGSLFQWQPDGSYFWNDAAGKTVQRYVPSTGDILSVRDGITLSSLDGYRSYSSSAGQIEYNERGDPQYILTPAGKDSPVYTYFVDSSKNIIACSVKTAKGIRFDYFPNDRTVLAISGAQAVTIDAQYNKVHSVFDAAKRKATDILSLYVPQGIRLANLGSADTQYAELNPAWPEGYKLRQIGPFDVWYTDHDAGLLSKMSADRLSAIESKVRSISGLSGAKRRSIVIPPDLASYRRLHSSVPGEIISWYPSGFASLDYITLWPISVPRYDKPVGQDYFFNQELYEIISHEYVHLLVGENAGLISPVPIWLNEGLAVYTECQLYPDAKKYWDTTLLVVIGKKSFLPWDDVTAKTTGEYPIAEARVHYAQSYGMVSYLIGKFGVSKVDAYVKSFRVKVTDAKNVSLVSDYKQKFKTIFGVDWDGGKDWLDSLSKK